MGFEAAEPGDYRLELQFRPVQREMGAWGGFEMPILRLAHSRLELALPGEIPGIEAASALGASGVESDPPRFWAESGAKQQPGGALAGIGGKKRRGRRD